MCATTGDERHCLGVHDPSERSPHPVRSYPVCVHASQSLHDPGLTSEQPDRYVPSPHTAESHGVHVPSDAVPSQSGLYCPDGHEGHEAFEQESVLPPFEVKYFPDSIEQDTQDPLDCPVHPLKYSPIEHVVVARQFVHSPSFNPPHPELKENDPHVGHATQDPLLVPSQESLYCPSEQSL